MNVRLAEEKDLSRVNELRKQVNDLHVMGKPEVFKAGFSRILRAFGLPDCCTAELLCTAELSGSRPEYTEIQYKPYQI